MEDKKRGVRGRPAGIPREGRYGAGVKTKTVRVPEHLADKIDSLIAEREAIQACIEAWKAEKLQAASSPRYDKLGVMIDELEQIMS